MSQTSLKADISHSSRSLLEVDFKNGGLVLDAGTDKWKYACPRLLSLETPSQTDGSRMNALS